MSNPNETPAQLRRDELTAGFWKAVERIQYAAVGLAKSDDGDDLPDKMGVSFRLVGEINGHVIDVPLLDADAKPFVHATEEDS